MNTTCVNTKEGVFDQATEVRAVDTLSNRLSRVFNGLVNALALWQHRADERRHLLELDERMLRDIGLSRYDALKEAAKPFWKD